jgi:alkanesulfonate monooxygenase SsuD/methylene tetrahydromethanopterin reductase-like flavin-dependent oxidoreductase (luciferase family)
MLPMAELHLGVAVDFAPPPGEGYAQNLERLRPVLAACERLGYDLLSAGESYVFDPADPMGFHAPNALMVLAGVARETAVPRLATGALLLAAWDPLRLAYDAALVDQLSNGRLILGVGLGAPPLWETFGMASDALGEAAEAAITTVRRAWAGERIGVDDRRLVPLPVQAGGPPIWIGGARKRSAERAAALGDGWTASSGYSFDLVARQAATYREALAGGPPTVSVNRIAVVASTEAEAHERGRRYAGQLLAAYGGAGVLGAGTTYEELHPEHCLIGSPASVVDTLGRYAEAGVTHVQLRVRPMHLPVELAIETLELVAAEVRPAFGPTHPAETA